jgi:glycosyltransferase involved in cell wall biosynthesis
MKVLVYAAGIHRGGGPANHLRQFLTTLSSTETDHEWTFIVNRDFPVPDTMSPDISIRPLHVRGPVDRMYQDFWRQRVDARRAPIDVLLNLADFGPVPRGLPVVTFQRNQNYYYPGLLELRSGLNRVNWELRRQLAHWVVSKSDRVLCPSQTMADSVATVVTSAAPRVHALRHPYSVGTCAWTPEEPPRILYVGHLMPHKNHLWLLRVFAASKLAQDGVELWMTAAREDWPDGYDALVNSARAARISNSVRLLQRVPPSELPELYRTSTLFAFASIGESFGFPLIEALAAGTPTLALDTPIAREIAADAAQYLSADEDEAGQALRAAAHADPRELSRWSRIARTRAEEFCVTWPEWVGQLGKELEAACVERSR